MDVFDTIGTLVGVGSQAGLMKNDELPNASQAMKADSISTVFGSLCGNSTVTCYIESAAGVQFGGKTGLTAVSAGLCFLLAMFLSPLVAMVGTYPGKENPITAPALVIVGSMMLKNVIKIKWDDFSEAIPAFLVLIGIPFTSSIADGMIFGFIAYPVIKLCSGKGKDVGWLTYLIGGILILYLIFIKPIT
jgi:AGZA family xanthine/uracil permease-like MFS transporter